VAQNKFNVELTDTGFRLVRISDSGERWEMLLSEADILQITQAAQRLSDKTAARFRQAGLANVTSRPLVQVQLNTDVLKTKLILWLIDQNGTEERFSLPLELARGLMARLPRHVADLEAAALSTPKQYAICHRGRRPLALWHVYRGQP
jgi:hypothetical protein